MAQLKESMKLEAAVRRAVEALRTEGIEGWGLSPSVKTLARIGGKVIEIQGATGCKSETCTHASHSFAAPWYRWIPDQGDQLVLLGEDEWEDRTITWYVLRRASGEDVYLELTRPEYYWARVRVVDPADIPEWVFAGLVSGQGDE